MPRGSSSSKTTNLSHEVTELRRQVTALTGDVENMSGRVEEILELVKRFELVLDLNMRSMDGNQQKLVSAMEILSDSTNAPVEQQPRATSSGLTDSVSKIAAKMIPHPFTRVTAEGKRKKKRLDAESFYNTMKTERALALTNLATSLGLTVSTKKSMPEKKAGAKEKSGSNGPKSGSDGDEPDSDESGNDDSSNDESGNGESDSSESDPDSDEEVKDLVEVKMTWIGVPEPSRNVTLKGFEQSVIDRIAIDLSCCEEHWASEHMLSEAWNNKKKFKINSNADSRRTSSFSYSDFLKDGNDLLGLLNRDESMAPSVLQNNTNMTL
ncbi:hypothetical protein BJV82DRAFT_675904 [Fennellomyces sp. T-0311]|nr:hypothetical protein BJV82DRAFT_675904 [Fennellomyces sp. T-0311]